MNYSNYRFNLDVQSTVSQVSLPVRLLDTGRRLYIGLTDGGTPYIIEDGCRAVFYAKKADGKTIMNDCIIERGAIIRYDLSKQTTACAGVVDCEVRLYGTENNLITSPRFIMVVNERVVHDDDIPLSESEQSVLDNILLTETARENAEKLRTDAEAERDATFANLTEEVNEAVGRANEAAEAADSAVATANQAAQNAVQIATEAGERANAMAQSATMTAEFALAKANSHTHDYIPTSQRGVANGVAGLDAGGKVPSSQLPSYVDDLTAHNQAASTITAGTFAGKVVANASGQTPSVSCLRNSKLVSADTNPTVNGEICLTYA